MATRVPQPASQVATPQHYAHPTTRELRAQTVHRLQIGLSGLAAMLLLVGLANIIMDRARQNEAERGLSASPAAAASGKQREGAADPLVDSGVAPALNPSAKAPRDK